MSRSNFKLVATAALVIATVAVAQGELPEPGVTVDETTALVITDPQNDFLSPDGVTWEMLGANVTANNTVENLETLMKTAKAKGIPVFISPH